MHAAMSKPDKIAGLKSEDPEYTPSVTRASAPSPATASLRGLSKEYYSDPFFRDPFFRQSVSQDFSLKIQGIEPARDFPSFEVE